MIKKKNSFLNTILSVACCFFVCLASTFDKEERQVFAENIGNQIGQLSVYLYYYTYGGSYNRYKEYDDNRMTYNSTLECYSIDIVLFEGDYFAPNITGQGFAYYSNNLSAKTKEALAQQNITAHAGGNQFHVNKSGTYRISMSSHIDFYSDVNDFYKIWDDEQSKIGYLSDSTATSLPLGNYDIYLVGNFDQAGWNGSRRSDMMFSYNSETKCYEFFYNLCKNDIFCPESINQKRFKYFKSEYTNQLFEKNHIGESTEGYFVCKKDGYYKISLNYRIEYLYDNSFIWSEDIGSTITYLGEQISPNVKGNEDIILTGKIHGVDSMINSSVYTLKYDHVSKQYKITVFFEEGDYVRPYLKNKGRNIYCRSNSQFLKQMCDGINVTFTTISNIPSLEIHNSGYYEIAIGANVENLQDESLCWLAHGNSYIRFIGKGDYFVFVSSDSLLDNVANIYANGDSNVQQYGLDGIDFFAVNYIKLNSSDSSGYFYKIQYDPLYTKNICITSNRSDVINSLNISPENLKCYIFETGNNDIFLGEACGFLSELSDQFDSIKCGDVFVADFSNFDADQAKNLLDYYSTLSPKSKIHVDDALISSVDSQGKEKQIHFTDIIPFLNSIVKKSEKEKRMRIVVYIVLGFTLSLFACLLALSFKRNRSNKIILAKAEAGEDSIHVDI